MAQPGAVPAAAPDDAVAGHYGDPSAEQRGMLRGAIVDRSHRGLVVVDGPDRLEWLHALTSQDLLALPAGVPTELLVLSPHGQVEHQADVVDDGTRTWLLVEGPDAAPLATWLDSMRFMSRVQVTDLSEKSATLTLTGERADELADLIAAAHPVTLRRRRRWPFGSLDLIVSPDVVDAAIITARGAGAVLAGHDAFEAARIAAGAARLSMDTDHKTLVHEVGWLDSAVALDKGCYRGQETVARVHNLGRPPRRMVLVHVDGSGHVLPAVGGALTDADGRTVGTLTSVARHHELGPIGLALLRRSVPEDAALLSADGIAVAIEADLSSPTEPVDLSGVR